MGGSISAETVWQIISRNGNYEPAKSLQAVRKRMACNPIEDQRNFSLFLSKFSILDEVTWDAWAINLAIGQICDAVRSEGTKIVDISFSIEKYVRSGLWGYNRVVRFICDTYQQHAERTGIEVGLLLSLSYHSPRQNQAEVASLIDNPAIAGKLLGLDLVGDERYYDPEFYAPIIEKWNKAGKVTREHLAEMPGTGHRLHDTLNRPRAQQPNRIAHGIQGTWDDLRRAADNGIIFDLALQSNLATGAVHDILYHPLPKMLKAGCMVTLNTDDPIQFNCVLDDEFDLALKAGLITPHEALGIQANGVIGLQ